MDIQARILARKMVLTYLYEKCSAAYLASQEHVLKEINDIDISHSALEQKDTATTKELAISIEKQFPVEGYDNDMTYLAQHCFEKFAERGLDIAYLQSMAPAYDKFNDAIPALVNTYTTTFQYNDMDIIDRAIFLLGYAEYKLIQTPKEVILNEMIELAKKYGDDGSSKLINGILHKILTAEEAAK